MPTTIHIDTHSPTNSSRSTSRSKSFIDEEASSASGERAISGSGSDSDSLEDWHQVYSDEIEPSESASRPPRTSGRYRSSESRPPTSRAPTRRHRATERSARRPSASRVHRVHPVLAPPSSVDPEDYPGYGRGYPVPPTAPYGGRVPPGYAQSSYSSPAGGPYAPPFGTPAPGALAPYGAPAGYPNYPSTNPFSPQPPPTTAGGAAYFSGGHHPMSGHNTPAPFGHEMMPFPPPVPGYGYQGYQQPTPHQQHMPYYPQQWPPVEREGSQTGDSELEKKLLAINLDYEKAKKEIASRDAAAAAKEAAELEAKRKADADAYAAKRAAEERASWEAKLEKEKKAAEEELEKEKKKAEEDKAAWEKKFEEEKKAAQARGAEAAKKQIEADRKKAEERAAEEKAKADAKAAVIKAEADAKAAVEKAEKESKEAVDKAEKEAKDAVDKAEKDAKASIQKALTPKDDKKKPIKFKDAVGRKFSFPFHLCTTWAGMEDLIKQAFLHVDVIGPHVLEGHYDLIGPNGEIILPQVWETVVEPDWTISMHMWPIPEKAPPGPPGPPGPHHFNPREHEGRPASRRESRHHGQRPPPGPPPPPIHRGDPRAGMPPPPPPPGWPPGAPPPPRPGAGPPGGRPPGEPPIILVPPNGGGASRPGGSSRRRAELPKGVLGWMAGSKPKSSGKGSKKAEQPGACLVM